MYKVLTEIKDKLKLSYRDMAYIFGVSRTLVFNDIKRKRVNYPNKIDSFYVHKMNMIKSNLIPKIDKMDYRIMSMPERKTLVDSIKKGDFESVIEIHDRIKKLNESRIKLNDVIGV